MEGFPEDNRSKPVNDAEIESIHEGPKTPTTLIEQKRCKKTKFRSSKLELPMDKKMLVIRKSDEGWSQRKIAQLFRVSKTQVHRIIARKDQVEKFVAENGLSSKNKFWRKSLTRQSVLNEKTKEWYDLAKACNRTVTGPQVQTAAMIIADILNVSDFKASNGWLDSFRRRHRISFKTQRTDENEPTTTSNDPFAKATYTAPYHSVSGDFNWQTDFFNNLSPPKMVKNPDPHVYDACDSNSSSLNSPEWNDVGKTFPHDIEDGHEDSAESLVPSSTTTLPNGSTISVSNQEAYDALQKLKIFAFQHGLTEFHDTLCHHERAISNIVFHR